MKLGAAFLLGILIAFPRDEIEMHAALADFVKTNGELRASSAKLRDACQLQQRTQRVPYRVTT